MKNSLKLTKVVCKDAVKIVGDKIGVRGYFVYVTQYYG